MLFLYNLKKFVKTVLFFVQVFCYKKQIVLIYQMGKVGSSSIRKSLGKYTSLFVLHLHRIAPVSNCKVAREYKKKQIAEPHDLYLGRLVYRHIPPLKRPVKIITLVREPIGRNFSAFFQNFNVFNDQNSCTADVDDIIEVFMSQYPHEVPLVWFDEELKESFGVDIYEYEFPKDKGWLVVKRDNVEVLILKLEIDDEVKEQQIANFLNITAFSLKNINIGSAKEYAKKYREFKNNIRLSEEYVSRMCDSRYCSHFYSDAEIEKIKSKWL